MDKIAEVAAARYSKLSAEYLRIRKEIARLKTEASRLKRDMRKLETEAEDRLVRDEEMETEQLLASCLDERGSLVVPSGLEFDFSESAFPELGGGPMTFWAGSFDEDTALAANDKGS